MSTIEMREPSAAGQSGSMIGNVAPGRGRPAAPTVEAAITDFLGTLAGKSPRTRATYSSALRRLVEHLEWGGLIPGSTPTDRLPADVLERFYTWLVRAYGKERRFTLQTYVAGARAFFRFLVRRRIAPPETSFEEAKAGLQEVMGRATYRTPRIDHRLYQIVQYVEALSLPNGGEAARRLELLRDKAILRTLFCTGIRRAELCSLNRSDLDDGWSDQALITGKGEKERVVFFDEPTLETIRRYLEARADSYRPLFLRHNRGKGKPGPGGANYRLSPQSVWLVVKKYAALAGVPAKTHDFRHAKASVMLNRGAKLSEVQDILGHASPETTKKIYAHYEVSHLREAFDRFSATPDELAAEAARRRPSTEA
jgi:site-specific recombinase XerD